MIIADTIKGKGFPLWKTNLNGTPGALNDEEYAWPWKELAIKGGAVK